MPSVSELISSIKAKSASNTFVSQAKKRKTESQPAPSNKKSRTATEKKDKKEDAILSKLNKLGQQFMESVDASQQKPKKKGKKAASKPVIELTNFEAIDTMDKEEDDTIDEKDEIDQLFGTTSANTMNDSIESTPEEKEIDTNNKGPQVVVFSDSTSKKTVTGTSKAEYKAFMSSKVSKMEAPPPPPPKSVKELEEEEENQAHDRELKELLATSKLLEEYVSPCMYKELEEMTGKERRRHNMNKLETLGVKKSKALKMPIQMRLGMDQKQKEREQKKLQEAKDIGLYDKSLKHLYAAAVKPKDNKPRDKGITSGIGKMRGSTLTLSKNEIKRVEREGNKPKAVKGRKAGKGGSKGGSKGGKSGKGGKKGRR
ncbi:hypothetical protein NQZ79_g5151 [Umbelopsis isabellina]|nr:hypothetical protein NQZ79_g5151 [Umbelopsis isabellina]